MRRAQVKQAGPAWVESVAELFDLTCDPELFAAVLDLPEDSHQVALLGTGSKRVILPTPDVPEVRPAQ